MTRWAKPLAAVFLVLYMVVQILSFRLREQQNLSAAGKVVVFLAAPMQNAAWKSVGWIGDVWNHYVALTKTSMVNERLIKEIETLRSQISEMKEAEAENARLRAVMELKEKEHLELLTAERIASGASPFEFTIRVHRGAAEGVNREMGVIHPAGAVGQVVQTYRHDSDILLIADASSAVDAMSQRSRARGTLRGAGMQELRLEYLSKNDDVKKDDEIVTTGLDGIFPKGIPIGVVTNVIKDSKGLFYAATVRPHVDFNRLEEVAIVLEGED